MRRAAALGFVAVALAQAPALRPGELTDGSTLLATGWRIRPAGAQVPVGGQPLALALYADDKFLLSVSAGSPGAVSVIRTDTLEVVSRAAMEEAWQGIAVSSDGRHVYVAGGARNSVFEFALSGEGELTLTQEMPGAAAGGHIGSLAIPPAGRLIYATDLLHNEILVFNPQSGRVIDRYRTGRRPNQIVFAPEGRTFFVSSWADGTLLEHRTNNGEEIARIRVAPHPFGIAVSDRRLPEEPNPFALRVFVAAANTNNLFVIGVDRNDLLRLSDVLNIGFAPGQPAGASPTAVALSRDQTRVFVALANVNAVAVADTSEARSRLAGFLPVGAHPAAITVLRDHRLAVANARSGSVSVLPALTEPLLRRWTEQAVELVGYDPAEPALAAAPVENAVLILFSGIPGPNHAKLGREFARIEHFFPNAPGAEGLEWLLSGVPSDFAQRLGGAAFVARDPANQPPAGTLLSNARAAGLSTAESGPARPVNLPAALPRFALLRVDDDAALGEVIQTLSRSPGWAKTAAFVVAENAAPLVISPYSRQSRAPEGMFYNHSSILRTIEWILGLRPLTVFDASARPLTQVFSATADPRPFTAELP
jgi:DNA-binding beta-propeller fold protein YncE